MNKFYMAGTEGTGTYLVLAISPAGRVGMRDLGTGSVRVRAEPSDDVAALPLTEGWKQPDSQHRRYSRVVEGQLTLAATIQEGIGALGGNVELNPDLPSWAQALVADTQTTPAPTTPFAEAPILNLPGTSLALAEALSAAEGEVSDFADAAKNAQTAATKAETKAKAARTLADKAREKATNAQATANAAADLLTQLRGLLRQTSGDADTDEELTED